MCRAFPSPPRHRQVASQPSGRTHSKLPPVEDSPSTMSRKPNPRGVVKSVPRATVRRRSKRPAAPENGTPRTAASGDITPAVTAEGIQRLTVLETTRAAQEAKINAVRDMVSQVPPHDVETLARVLSAILQGASPDDAAVLKQALMKSVESAAAEVPTIADEELSSEWRSGRYPYQFLLSRRSCEKQKYRLQVELLKLQSWVRNTGQRVVILFEGRDAAGKGGTIKRFMEHLNP